MKTLALLLLGLAASVWPLARALGDDTLQVPATAPAALNLYPVDDLQEIPLFKFVATSEGENLTLGSSEGRPYGYPGHFRRYILGNILTGEQHDFFTREPADPQQSQILQAIKAAGPNALLMITSRKEVRRDILTDVAPYPTRDGEDRPNVFLFVASQVPGSDAKREASIKLYKFGRFAVVRVPVMLTSAGRRPGPDPLSEAVSRLQPGQMVEVETTGSSVAPILRKISALPPLQNGTLAKTGLEDIDGVKIPAVHITIGGEDKMFLIPGKKAGKDRWTTDGRVSLAVRTCKAQGPVTFRAYEDNGHWWLREIGPAKPSIFNK